MLRQLRLLRAIPRASPIKHRLLVRALGSHGHNDHAGQGASEFKQTGDGPGPYGHQREPDGWFKPYAPKPWDGPVGSGAPGKSGDEFMTDHYTAVPGKTALSDFFTMISCLVATFGAAIVFHHLFRTRRDTPRVEEFMTPEVAAANAYSDADIARKLKDIVDKSRLSEAEHKILASHVPDTPETRHPGKVFRHSLMDVTLEQVRELAAQDPRMQAAIALVGDEILRSVPGFPRHLLGPLALIQLKKQGFDVPVPAEALSPTGSNLSGISPSVVLVNQIARETERAKAQMLAEAKATGVAGADDDDDEEEEEEEEPTVENLGATEAHRVMTEVARGFAHQLVQQEMGTEAATRQVCELVEQAVTDAPRVRDWNADFERRLEVAKAKAAYATMEEYVPDKIRATKQRLQAAGATQSPRRTIEGKPLMVDEHITNLDHSVIFTNDHRKRIHQFLRHDPDYLELEAEWRAEADRRAVYAPLAIVGKAASPTTVAHALELRARLPDMPSLPRFDHSEEYKKKARRAAFAIPGGRYVADI